MGEYGQTSFRHGNWRRRALIALGIFGGLFLIFHRPLLLGLGHRIALHYAAKENLKLEFQVEGSVFTNFIIKNLHAASTGPGDVESIDVDLARIDYGLFTLLRHGISTAINGAVLLKTKSDKTVTALEVKVIEEHTTTEGRGTISARRPKPPSWAR